MVPCRQSKKRSAGGRRRIRRREVFHRLPRQQARSARRSLPRVLSFLGESADWAACGRCVLCAARAGHAAASLPRMVNHNRFSAAEPRAPRLDGHKAIALSTPYAGVKVCPTVVVSCLLKITSASLKGRLGAGRYHGCRKLSTHVSLRHIGLKRRLLVVTESGHGLVRLATTPT